jgi:SAM-dependent methyltransferase
MNEICIVCKKKSKVYISKLGSFPLCDDLIKIGSNKKNKSYPINLRYCKVCNTIFNNHKIKQTVIFPKNYHYRAKLTKDVLNGQRDLINFLINGNNKLKNKTVLDIGCNDGALLDLLRKKGAKTIGVEPTNAAKDANSYHDIYNSFFDDKVVKIIKKKYTKIDYIIFTNVFAHINNFHKLIKNLKKLLSPQTKLVIENHYLGSVINKFQFDTFYHEHPRTYSLTSFYYISKMLGLKIENFNFPKRYGGNIRVVYSNSSQNKQVLDILKKEKKYFRLFNKNYLKFKKWTEIMKKKLSNLEIKYGPLKGKAFPGRAALIVKFLNLDEKKIDIIFEQKNSKKIGCYVPGTKIKIVSDSLIKKNLKNYKGPLINFAWHINKEIKSYLKKKKIYNEIIDIINVKEIKKL